MSKSTKVKRSNKYSRGNLIYLGLTITLILIGSIYYHHQRALNLTARLTSSSPIPTSSSRVEYLTYTNDRYGYSFDYPNNVEVTENMGKFGYFEADAQSRFIMLLNSNSSSPSQSFGVDELELPPGISLMDYIKKTNYYQNGILTNSGEPYDIMPNRKILSLEEFKVDDKPAVKLVSQILPGQGSVEDIYFETLIEYKPGRALSISDGLATYHPLEFDEQIVNSFHFFAPKPAADWVKYSYAEFNFHFSLPPTWTISPSDLVSSPQFTLSDNKSTIYGSFRLDGTLGQRAHIENWSNRPDPRAVYSLLQYDYDHVDNYSCMAKIKTPQLFVIEVFIPLQNNHNLILRIDDPNLELTFYRLLNTLSLGE